MLKVIAYYLPQFHSIPENDEVWGKGFTEWNSVRSAKKLFDGHNQPRVPKNENYYNLLDEDVIKWQTDLAKSHNVFGFCVYHYWFSGKILLDKPLKLMRESGKINFPYCICWANESWGDAWVSDKPKTFLEQKYGDTEEWKAHFDYLLQYFKDPNYICEDNKPMVVIYRPETIPNLNQRLNFWIKLAQENGFDGLTFAYQQKDFEDLKDKDDSDFKYSIEYQPRYALDDLKNDKQSKLKQIIKKIVGSHSKTVLKIKNKIVKKNGNTPKIYNYNDVADAIINRTSQNDKSIAGMIVGYDDTPRKGVRGSVIQSNPAQFRAYLFKQVENVKLNYRNDYLFMFAWNEWGESGYLEPDTKYGAQYLDAIRDAVDYYNDI